MQAIVVKFLPPTNTLPARWQARAQAGAISIVQDEAKNPTQNACASAMHFAKKYHWTGRWVGGGLPDGSMAFVNVSTAEHLSFEVES